MVFLILSSKQRPNSTHCVMAQRTHDSIYWPSVESNVKTQRMNFDKMNDVCVRCHERAQIPLNALRFRIFASHKHTYTKRSSRDTPFVCHSLSYISSLLQLARKIKFKYFVFYVCHCVEIEKSTTFSGQFSSRFYWVRALKVFIGLHSFYIFRWVKRISYSFYANCTTHAVFVGKEQNAQIIFKHSVW